MFVKKLISFIFAHIILLGGSYTHVYVAPTSTDPQIKTPISTETSMTTKKISTTTPATKQKIVAKKLPITKVSSTTSNTKSKTQNTLEIPKINLPTFDFETINKNARDVIINILCTTKGSELSPVSGTGVVVGQSGLILTNAHLGQYLLLKDFGGKDNVKCIARTGSPAYPKYDLELVYISPIWVSSNKALLKEQNPQGTGENDFAFLRITGNVDGSNLPEGFRFIPMNINEYIEKGQPVILISYPAGFLGGLSILQDLSITSAITLVNEIYTFKENTIDLISVPGTVVSQKGSSGGAVIDEHATLIGIISTSSNGDTTNQRDLRAITIPYINRDLQKELGMSLKEFVQNDPKVFAQKFQEINAPTLTKIITDELSK